MPHDAPEKREFAVSDRSISATDWVKAHLTDYEVVRRIGSGGYGEVWLGRDVLGIYRAIKVLRRQTLSAERPFQREFEGIKRFDPISRTHPGLVCILHVGGNPSAGYFYYAMELADDVVSGQKCDPATYVPKTLNSELTERGKLPWDECLNLALDLSAALGHLHKSGLIHRDIKPANVIFSQGRPKLADIGLVTEIGEKDSNAATVGYVPPEGHGQPTGDIYSLGKVLYQACTGQVLLHFDPRTLPPEPSAEPRLKRFHELVRQACELNPNKRLPSAEDLHHELRKLCGPDQPNQPLQRIAPAELHVVIILQPDLPLDAEVAGRLRTSLEQHHCQVFLNRHLGLGLEAARELERQIARADVAIVLLSSHSVHNEMLALEVEMAQEAARKSQGRPRLLAVRLKWPDPLPDQLTGALNPVPHFSWEGPRDDELLTAGVVTAVRSASEPVLKLQAPYGAVPLDSAFYVTRPADQDFKAAIRDREGLVLVKGARQMGKTSLLARGLQEARDAGFRVVWTDFQKLNASAFESLEKLYLALGESLAACLHVDVFPTDGWDPRHSPNHNFERYLRQEILEKASTHLVWGMDEVDRLILCSFCSEVFGLFRAWYNERSVDPTTPWTRLTAAMSYATEAHLFITNLDMSPFNVGTRLALRDFSEAQVADLNRRYGSPLRTSGEVSRFTGLLGGQPFLVRRGLHELATQPMDLDEFERRSGEDQGIFGDHLRRLLLALAKDALLVQAVRQILLGQGRPAPDAFYRLRSAGLVVGDSPSSVEPHCRLYSDYLKQHLL